MGDGKAAGAHIPNPSGYYLAAAEVMYSEVQQLGVSAQKNFVICKSASRNPDNSLLFHRDAERLKHPLLHRKDGSVVREFNGLFACIKDNEFDLEGHLECVWAHAEAAVGCIQNCPLALE